MIILELIKNRLMALSVFRRDFWRLSVKTKIGLFKLAIGEKPIFAGGHLFISIFAVPCNGPLYKRYLNWAENFFNGIYTPRSLCICSTNNCLYNCEHCSNKNAVIGQEISSEEIKMVCDFFIEKGVYRIIFTGGEPLLRPNLSSIIAGLDKSLTCVILCTTGYGLSLEKARQLKEAGLMIIKIGFDFSNEEENDRYKNFKGAFKNSVEAIKNSLEVGLCVVAQTVLKRQLIESPQKFFEFVNFLEKLGVHELEFLEPKPCGNYISSDEIIGQDEKEKFYNLSKKINRGFRRIKCSSYFKQEDELGCMAGLCNFYLDAIGNLMPCVFVQKSLGNIRNKNLEEIYKNFNSHFIKPGKNCLSHEISKQKLTF